MGLFKNFKTVTYGVSMWADRITEEELRRQADWLQKYVGIDKIYLETYRGEFAREEQILMIKKVLEEYNIEVSGGITTVTPNLNDSDKNRQRLFDTFCYCNQPMRDLLKKVSQYTAKLFDEFIIDDFYFTQCTCQDCQKEKGSRTWEQFRLEKMEEVSRNLIINPAKEVNPNVKVIIKYPNWRESYQETGYNPQVQRHMFDGIYTGTETRHGAQQDQHLPRYLSYSLPRYMENVSPGRNGGGWFDNFECDRIDSYLEQAYLTAFAKSKELMMFCWPSIYNDKRATPLGYQYARIDKILSHTGNPTGLPVYIPFNSQGEDHLEDYLGMIGIPFEPTPDFPSYNPTGNTATENSTVFITAASLKDKDIIQKIHSFVNAGGKVLATSGFVIQALSQAEQVEQAEQAEQSPQPATSVPQTDCPAPETQPTQPTQPTQTPSHITIKDLTSIRYRNRNLDADEFQVTVNGLYGRNYVKSATPISFPLLEHRNNATWSKTNAGHGEYHESIMMYDTFGKGTFQTVVLPHMPSKIRDLPKEVLTSLRQELLGNITIYLESGYGVSLFTYDNETFGLYCYTNDGCAPTDLNIHIKGKSTSLTRIWDFDGTPPKFVQQETKPLYSLDNNEETVFHTRILPGDFQFFKINR